MGAAEKLRAEIVKVAAFALQAEADEIELRDGTALGARRRASGRSRSSASPTSSTPTSRRCPASSRDSVSLNCRHVYRPPFEVPDPEAKTGNLTLTYASQIHACVVEIDEETGQVTILDYAVVDDCGTRDQPADRRGAGARRDGARHRRRAVGDVRVRRGRAAAAVVVLRLPRGHLARRPPHQDRRTSRARRPFTPNGAKGMGEGGGAPLHAICSAIQDALGPRRADRLRQPQPLGAGVVGCCTRAGRARGVEVTSR